MVHALRKLRWVKLYAVFIDLIFILSGILMVACYVWLGFTAETNFARLGGSWNYSQWVLFAGLGGAVVVFFSGFISANRDGLCWLGRSILLLITIIIYIVSYCTAQAQFVIINASKKLGEKERVELMKSHPNIKVIFRRDRSGGTLIICLSENEYAIRDALRR